MIGLYGLLTTQRGLFAMFVVLCLLLCDQTIVTDG